MQRTRRHRSTAPSARRDSADAGLLALRGLRRRRLWVALLACLVAMGMAFAQDDDHDHEHAAPPPGLGSMADQLSDQLGRTTTVQVGDADVEITATWATPAWFRAAEPEALDAWSPTDRIVVRIDETTHGADLPATSAVVAPTLIVDGTRYAAERSEVDTSEEHHRITTVSFALSPYQPGEVALELEGGTTFAWDAGRWFGLSPDERSVVVRATDDGFKPTRLRVDAGQPLIFVFQNESETEHHFHIMGLQPVDLRWFQMAVHDLDDYGPDALRTGERMTGHMCTSDSGICRLGTNVHLHANPHEFDAVGFVAPESGTFLVVCPLHAEMTAELIVR